MRRALAVVILCLPGVVLAQDKKPDPKKKAEPKVWMCKRGELLWEQHFEGDFPKEWHKGKGDWQIDGDALKGAEVAADKHNTYMSREITTPNVIVQFSFKLQGCPWMGASVDGKEHVSHLTLQPDSVRIAKVTGIGPTTKHTEVDFTKTKLNDEAWHTVVWEIYNEEMVATIDDKDMTLAKAEGLSMDRNHLELNNGGQWAWFKDIKVWKAELDDHWPQKRTQLMQMLKKKDKSTAQGK
ncbi:MAG TPA: hypothetical protein VEN81_04225 [Planctomycetota bacterium]|nr:hypothetical protein [Planctomycetota bacterium]